MVKPIWIFLKQETVSGSGISRATSKSAPRSRQITTPAPHHSVFTGRMPFLPPNQQRQRTEGSNSTTGNRTILTVMLLFNVVSLQDNTEFTSFYKSAEACSIEVFVGCS